MSQRRKRESRTHALKNSEMVEATTKKRYSKIIFSKENVVLTDALGIVHLMLLRAFPRSLLVAIYYELFEGSLSH